jgi:glutaminase
MGSLTLSEYHRRPQPRRGLSDAQPGMLAGDVEATLELYLQQCSVQVTCRDLAVMAATLANGAVNPLTGASVMPEAGCGTCSA